MKKTSPLSVGGLLFAVVVLAVNLRSPIVAFGPVVELIRQDLHLSGTFMGMVAALPMLAFALFSPMAAKLSAKWGLEKVLVGSIVVMMVGMLVRSAYPSAVLLVLGTVILSAAIAMGNVLLPAMAKRNLPTRIGLVVGVLTAVMSLSAAFASAVSVPLAQWQNWRWSLSVWLLTAMLALLVWLFVEKRVNTENVATASSSDGINVWKLPSAWCISAMMGGQSLIFYAVMNFLPSILLERGMTLLQGGGFSSLMQVASLLGVWLASSLLGRSRHKQIISVLLAVCLLVGTLGIWQGSVQLMWLWTACVGMGTTGLLSASLMLFGLRTDSPQQAAALSGMAQSVGYLIAVAGPLCVGWLHDVLGSWTSAMSALVAVALAECVLAWFAANPRPISAAHSGRDAV